MTAQGGHRTTTLRDVAERAQVSLSTASRALNGGHYVSPEALERVLAAAQELDYRANEGARALRRSRTMTVGVVFHQLRNQSVLDLLEGIESGCDERGYTVLVTSARDSTERYISMIRRFLERRVDAILLSNPTDDLRPEVDFARGAGVPVVALSTRTPLMSDVPIVHSPVRACLDAMAETVARHGHRAIAFVGSVRGTTGGRFPGLEAAAERHGITVVTQPAADYGEHSAMDALDALLARPDRPTALFVLVRNLSATLTRLAERGVRVPEDVSVIAMNDTSELGTVGLIAQIHVDPRHVGFEAAQVAVDWVEGKEPENRRSLSTAEWLPAPSLGSVPASVPGSR